MSRAGLALVVATVVLPLPALAGSGAAVLNAPLSVRQAGMGGVSAAGADLMRAWSNPAMLAGQGRRGEVALAGGSVFAGEQTAMGGGVGWLLSPTLAVGALAMLNSAGFDELSETGAPVGTRIDRSVQSFGVVAAKRIGPASLGAGVRTVSDVVGGSSASAIALDAGASAGVSRITVGAAVRNLGGTLRGEAEGGAGGDSLPLEIRAGVSYGMDRVIAGVEYAGVADRDATIGVGAEWRPAPVLALRAGAGLGGPAMQVTAGFSAALRGYTIDYALATHALGASHRASLTLAFGPTAGELAERVVASAPVQEAVAAVETPAPASVAEAEVPAAPVPAPARPSGKSTLAVASFDPQNVPAGDAAVISDMFRVELFKQGTFDVVEKTNMDKVLAEQAFQQSGCTTAECAVKLGKILNVRYLIVGSFGKLLDQYVLSFRVVETETAKVVYSDDARELSSQRDVYRAIESMASRLAKAFRNK